MKTCAAVLIGLMLIVHSAWAIDSAPAFSEPPLQARYDKLTHQLRCLVCQNETIADSNATLAGDLRRQLREMIAAGKSDDEILQYMTDRYGDFVLYRPPFKARTVLLWSAPVLLVLAGLIAAVMVIMRRARLPIDDLASDETPNGAAGDSERKAV
jgi:cytochrome c-type biogenesis protein CcmH